MASVHRRQMTADQENQTMKFKSFCTAKKTVDQVRRQPAEWGKKISASYIWQGINTLNIQRIKSRQQRQNRAARKQITQFIKWTIDLIRELQKEITHI